MPRTVVSLLLVALVSFLAAGCDSTQKVVVVYVDQNGNPIDPPPQIAKGGQRTTTITDSNTHKTPGDGSNPTSPQAQVVAPSPRVDKIELDVMPSPVNLDNIPGPDGVKVAIRLYNVQQPQGALALQQGAVEFVLFEGAVKETDIGAAEPFRVWRYSAGEMGGRKTLVGWQYAMNLSWIGQVPTSSVITIAARIPRPGESPLYAKPVMLAMNPR